MSKYQKGNTIKLNATFKDWNNEDIDPTNLKLIIYDSNYTKIDEREVFPSHRMQTGQYYYDYVFDNIGYFYYEWNATIDGTPSIIRNSIEISMI